MAKDSLDANGGNGPVWGRGSDKLYYEALGENNRVSIFEVAVATQGGLSEVGAPQLASDTDLPVSSTLGFSRGFDVVTDGQSFVVLKGEFFRPGVLEVVTNWFEELKERVPVP